MTRKRVGRITCSNGAVQLKPATMFQMRCTAPMCRNIEVKSRQYSPRHTSSREVAPNFSNVGMLWVEPSRSAIANTTMQMAKIVVETGAARRRWNNVGGASGGWLGTSELTRGP